MSDVARPDRGYLALLRNREYLGLLLSQIVSMIGDQLSRVALTVLVFERTASPFLSAATYAATFLPVVIGGPLLGGLADRLPRRQLLIAADLLRAALLALMAVPGLPIWVLLGLLMSTVVVEAPWRAARGPLLRDIVPDDDSFQLGTGLDETVQQTGQIVGFALAGALLSVIEPSTALLGDAASFLVSAAVVRMLVRSRPAADEAHVLVDDGTRGRGGAWPHRARQALGDARLGLTAALAESCRRPLLLTWAGISFAIAPEALATPWALQLGAGPLGIGLLFAAWPSGAVIGLLLIGRVSADRGQQLLLPLALLTLVPLLLAVAAPSLPVALLLVVLSGIGASYSLLARVAFIRGVGNAHRGRAFSVASAGVTAGQGLGIAAAGVAASLTTPALAVTLSGGLGLLMVALAHRLSEPPTAADDSAGASAVTPARDPDLPTVPRAQ